MMSSYSSGERRASARWVDGHHAPSLPCAASQCLPAPPYPAQARHLDPPTRPHRIRQRGFRVQRVTSKRILARSFRQVSMSRPEEPAMFGLRYLKAASTTYVMHYRGGKVTHQGAGLSFIYFAPTSVIVQVPVSSIDVPFAFTEVSSDFQDVTIQGNLTYRITEPAKLAALL